MVCFDFTGGDGTYHLKVLVPGVAAGAIIGKGGDTIAQLQKDTGARVKMSKSHDFYPGIHLAFSVHACSRSCLYSINYRFICLQELLREYALSQAP